MTDKVWVGGAPEVAQVDTITLPLDIESGQVFKATIELKTISYPFPDGPLRNEVAAEIVALFEASEIPEFAELTATDNGDGSFTLTADEPGRPFIISFVIGGGTDEIQIVAIGNNPTGGTFTLNFDGQVTGAIPHDASAATVKTALETLSNIAVDDIIVTGGDGGPWTIEFINNLSNTDVALLIGDVTNLLGTDEVQTVTLNSSTGGTFTLGYGGQTTANIAYNASAATVQTALEGLSSIGAGNVSVSGANGGPYTITFLNTLGKTDVENVVFDGANLTGFVDVSITETNPGSGGANERHIIQARINDFGSDQNGIVSLFGDASVTAGTWELEISIAASVIATITDIPWDVTIEGLQALIDAAMIDAGLNFRYKIFAAHEFANTAIGNEKFSDGDGAIYQFASSLNEALVTESPAFTIDNTGLTGGTFTSSGNNEIYIGDSGDYGTSSGSWTFKIDSESTDDLDPLITAAELQTAIEGLSSVGSGNVTVYQMGGVDGFAFGGGFIIEFKGDLGNQDTGFVITTGKSAGSGLNLTVWTGYTGSSGIGEVQNLSISGSPVSGTFGLTYGGENTIPLNHNASAATVQAALEGLAPIGVGGVVCTGGPLPDTPVVITFAGSLSGLDLDLIENVLGVVAESVQGGNAPTITTTTSQTPVSHAYTTESQGPNDWSTLANWDVNELPVNGDDVFIIDGDSIWYGLEQSAVTLNRLQIHNDDVQIGLPRRNEDYYEYRKRFLEIGAAEIVIGLGEGSGSDRINIDIGTTNPKIEIYDSGTGVDGEPAIQIKGVNAVNTAELLLLEGEVGVAIFPKEEAQLKITQRGGELFAGPDVTIRGFVKTDGDVTLDRTTIEGLATV